jgi:O-antigen/teichoic acid export membrane protein
MLANGIYNAGIAISGPLINLITIPIATKALGVHEFGESAVTLSIISYFTIVTTLGLAVYGTRELSQTKSNKSEQENIFTELLALSLIASCIGAILYIITALTLFPTDSSIIAIGAFTLILNFLNIEWLFYAHEDYRLIAYGTFISRLISLAAIYFFVNSPSDTGFYIAAILLSSVLPFIFIFIQHKKYTKIKLQKPNLKRHIKAIRSFLGIRIFSSVYTTLDIVIVGYVAGSSIAGLYAIAIRVARIVTSIICSLTAVVMPRASELQVGDKKIEYQSLLANTLVTTIALSLAASVSILLLSHPIIHFLGGKEYAAAQTALALLSLMPQVVGLSNFLGMQVLYPRKKERIVIASIALGSLVCITMLPVFVSMFNLNGAAVAILLSELAILLFQVFASKDLLMEIYSIYARRLKRFFALSLSNFAIIWIIYLYFGIANILIGIGLIAAFFAIYIAGLVVIKEPIIMKLINKACV